MLTQGDVADRLVADLAVDQMLADQHLARAGLERVEVDVPAPQTSAIAVERGDPVGIDEDAAALTARHESDDAGRDGRVAALAGTARDDDDVVEATDLGAGGVEQR